MTPDEIRLVDLLVRRSGANPVDAPKDVADEIRDCVERIRESRTPLELLEPSLESVKTYKRAREDWRRYAAMLAESGADFSGTVDSAITRLEGLIASKKAQ